MAVTSSRRAVVTLPADTQILITREFDAPARLVYRAWTEPELVRRWWGGDRGTVTSVDIDLRVGGPWRFVMTANAGFEVAFHGEYREIVPAQRLVWTEVFEGVPDAEALATVTFTEAGGLTTVDARAAHQPGAPGHARQLRNGGRPAGGPAPAGGSRAVAALSARTRRPRPVSWARSPGAGRPPPPDQGRRGSAGARARPGTARCS